MTFLNPLVLLGLIAASIPLLLHLLNLRKLKTVDFSTLRFLQELQKTQIRRLKLQQILLLILRTLIVVFAVLAFSRPVIKTALPGFGSHVKSSVVVLLDNSFSMDASDEGGNRLRQARTAAQQICSAMKDGDEVALITSSDVGSLQKIEFNRSLDRINERLQKIGVAPRRAELSSLMHMAASLLTQAQNLNKEIYVISDAQRNVLDDQPDSLRLSLNGASVTLVNIGENARIAGQNLSVDSLHVLSSIVQRDKSVDVEAFIRNCSDHDVHGLVVGMNFNDNRVAQRTMDIPAGQIRSTLLSAAAQQSGTVRASVEIENDAIELDNKRYFSFIIPQAPKVALIGTAESQRFLEAVLKTEAGQNLDTLSNISPSAFGSINVEQFDMLIISAGLSKADVSRVGSYVKNGGAVLFFAHEDTESLNNLATELGVGNVEEQKFSDAQPASFSSSDKNHPLFQGVFKLTDSRAVLESPRILRALPVHGGQMILGMQGGAFLAETRPGDGRVLYCAVPAHPGWSSFPITGLFPTVVFRSIPYLSAHEQIGGFSECGQVVSLVLPKRFSHGGRFVMRDAAGTNSVVEAVQLPSGAMLRLGAVHQPGVTQIQTENQEDVMCVATNINSTESQLSTWSSSEYEQALRRILDGSVEIRHIDAHRNIADSVARARVGTELWRLFVILAIVCALAEMLVAGRLGWSSQPSA